MRKVKYSDEQIIKAGRILEKNDLPVNGWSLQKELGGGRPDRLAHVWETATKSIKTVETTDEITKGTSEIKDATILHLDGIIDQMEQNLTWRDNRIEELNRSLERADILISSLESDRDEAESDRKEALMAAEKLTAENKLMTKELSQARRANSVLMTQNDGVARANVELLAEKDSLLEDLKKIALCNEQGGEITK